MPLSPAAPASPLESRDTLYELLEEALAVRRAATTTVARLVKGPSGRDELRRARVRVEALAAADGRLLERIERQVALIHRGSWPA
jgi:hypothetical protein